MRSIGERYTDEELPLITICMPVKNRAWCLPKVLPSIETLDYPKRKIKVIFVDDHSTDGSYEIIEKWSRNAEKLGFYKVEVIRAKTNIPQARNLCVKHMEGEILLFWDSDVVPPPELLREMVEELKRKPNVGIIGADYVYDPSTGIRYKPVTGKETHAVYMGFTLIRREVFEKAGLFNENLSVGEDTEFCIRVRERTGYRILWTPKPVLHLKRVEDIRRPGKFRRWLWYNFAVRAEEYYRSWHALPRFLKLRVIYWATWPYALVLLVMTMLSAVNNKTMLIPATLLLLYIVGSLYFNIRGRGFEGLREWLLSSVPTGISLSYGILRKAIKENIKRRCLK